MYLVVGHEDGLLSVKATELLYIENVPHVVELGRQMQQECEPDLSFSELETTANLLAVLNDVSRSECNIWIVWQDTEIVGFGVGYISKFLFSEMTKASLALWYVIPKYRKTRAAFEIMHNFENWAKINGSTRIEVGASRVGVDDVDTLNRMFARRGFSRYGELFYREL